METTVPMTNSEAELVREIMAMQHDYDNGLREFQEAIHYCIFHLFVSGRRHTRRKEAVRYVLYLRDLSQRLQRLEKIIDQKPQ
jgi:hypothetical protein